MDEPALLIETSGRGGRVGLAVGDTLRERPLDPARRHARDLAPAVQELLTEAGLKPRDVRRVGVSVGPGSFTGLRVGVMSAKAFAFATGCELVAVPTFAVYAEQLTDPTAEWVHVIADALQGQVYAEGFKRTDDVWGSMMPLRILPADEWKQEWGGWLAPTAAVTGPGFALVQDHLPHPHPHLQPTHAVRATATTVVLAAMLAVMRRLAPLSRDSMLALEPIYLRGSSAEEKAARDAAAKAERGC